MTHRKTVPKRIQDRIMMKCLYRCPLCFLLLRDDAQKKGQIAHIDHDSSNAKEDNLTFLCDEHHKLYDQTGHQVKGISPEMLRRARAKLHRHLASMDAEKFVVVLGLRQEDESGQYDPFEVLQSLQRVLQADRRIDIISVSRGNVAIGAL
jgi:hypothetical protein